MLVFGLFKKLDSILIKIYHLLGGWLGEFHIISLQISLPSYQRNYVKFDKRRYNVMGNFCTGKIDAPDNK